MVSHCQMDPACRHTSSVFKTYLKSILLSGNKIQRHNTTAMITHHFHPKPFSLKLVSLLSLHLLFFTKMLCLQFCYFNFLHPIFRFMFWTDVGPVPQQILRASMDGKSRVVIAADLDNVVALAVDRMADLLFWAQPNKIESSDVDGKGRYEICVFQFRTETY